MSTLTFVVVAFLIGAGRSWFADRIFIRGRRDGYRARRPLSSKLLAAVVGGIALGVVGAILGSLLNNRQAVGPSAAAQAGASPSASAAQPAAAVSRWVPARTVAKGRTNVRQGPKTTDPVVTMLLPGQDIEVDPGLEWSPVRLPGKAATLGFVRNDRIQR